MPSTELLDEIDGNRILFSNNNTNATVITVSRKASDFVNNVAINCFFPDCLPLIKAQWDCDLPPLPIYENLPVIITQNQNKRNAVVNGQQAVAKLVQNHTIFLILPNGAIVSTHLVTYNLKTA